MPTLDARKSTDDDSFSSFSSSPHFFFSIFSAQALQRPCPQFCSGHTEVQNPAPRRQVMHTDGSWLLCSVLCALHRGAEAGASAEAGCGGQGIRGGCVIGRDLN